MQASTSIVTVAGCRGTASSRNTRVSLINDERAHGLVRVATLNGVYAVNRVTVRGITAQGNDASGVFATRISLQDGVVTGNGPGQTSDLYAMRRIVLRNVICGFANFAGFCTNN